jgi:protein translocase SecG subunit
VTILYWVAWILLIVDSIFLILLILAQESKAQGLGGLGGGADSSFAGHAQRTAKKITIICACLFAICLVAVLWISPKIGKSSRGGLENFEVTPTPSAVAVTMQPSMPPMQSNNVPPPTRIPPTPTQPNNNPAQPPTPVPGTQNPGGGM